MAPQFFTEHRFTFEAAHYLDRDQTRAGRLHGHSFECTLRLGGARSYVGHVEAVEACLAPIIESRLDYRNLNETLASDRPTNARIAESIFGHLRQTCIGDLLVSVTIEATCTARTVFVQDLGGEKPKDASRAAVAALAARVSPEDRAAAWAKGDRENDAQRRAIAPPDSGEERRRSWNESLVEGARVRHSTRKGNDGEPIKGMVVDFGPDSIGGWFAVRWEGEAYREVYKRSDWGVAVVALPTPPPRPAQAPRPPLEPAPSPAATRRFQRGDRVRIRVLRDRPATDTFDDDKRRRDYFEGAFHLGGAVFTVERREAGNANKSDDAVPGMTDRGALLIKGAGFVLFDDEVEEVK